MLTVDEKFAGQVMKCPHCAGTFTVPNLPGAPAPAPAPPTPAAQPAPAAPDVYAVAPASGVAPAVPPSGATTSVQEAPPSTTTSPAVKDVPPPSQPSTAGYQRVFTVTFSPKVLMFVPPAAVVLIFFFQFLPWVGVYPGGVPAVTQSAWGAAFGMSPTEDADMKSIFKIPTEDEIKKDPDKVKDIRPGVNVLTIFYLLLFLPTLVVTVGCLALNYTHINLPKGLTPLLPWRWGIVAAANLLLFLFLALQILMGFSLENKVREAYDAGAPKKEAMTTVEQKVEAAKQGMVLGYLHRTVWLRLTVWLHLLAILCAALVFWAGRHENRPPPRIDVMW
jgi:hypothetical protein